MKKSYFWHYLFWIIVMHLAIILPAMAQSGDSNNKSILPGEERPVNTRRAPAEEQKEKEEIGKNKVPRPSEDRKVENRRRSESGKPSTEKAEKEKRGNTVSSREKKDHPGNGNAYGRNKGDLEGREFGKQRSEAARNKHKDKKDKKQW
jgi:hypothetical protein